jgi:DUF971 family protein
MTSVAVAPVRIDPYSSTEMLIEWNTGERFALPFREVRFLCPCAHCLDELTGRRKIQRGDVREDIRPAFVQVVGRYALQVTWTDGHQAGVYHFDFLHDLCGASGRRI